VVTGIFGDVLVAAGGLLIVLAGVVELGTEVCLELATGLLTSGIERLLTGDSDYYFFIYNTCRSADGRTSRSTVRFFNYFRIIIRVYV
jgi:hypothetical protein